MVVYATLLTAFITAFATLSGVFLSNRSQKERFELQINNEKVIKSNEILREKLEELYLLFMAWSTNLENTYINYTRGMNGYLDYETVLDLEIQRGKEITDNFDRIIMLIDLYFPNLRDEYNIVNDAKSSANEILLEYIRNNDLDRSHDGNKFVQNFLLRQEQFSEKTNNLQRLIAQQASDRILL
jgi:hypothetical protein